MNTQVTEKPTRSTAMAIAATLDLYPITHGGFPGCCECFQRTGDLAYSTNARTDTLELLCRDCCRTLAAGRPVTLPTGDALDETWQRLTRFHNNGDITDTVIDRALATLAPGLTPEIGQAAVLQLREALLKLQYIRGDMFDPADGDRDWLEGEADYDRENALAKLAGGTR